MTIGHAISQGLTVAFSNHPVALLYAGMASPAAMVGGWIAKGATTKVAHLILASDFGKKEWVKEFIVPRELAFVGFVLGFMATLIPAYFAVIYILCPPRQHTPRDPENRGKPLK